MTHNRCTDRAYWSAQIVEIARELVAQGRYIPIRDGVAANTGNRLAWALQELDALAGEKDAAGRYTPTSGKAETPPDATAAPAQEPVAWLIEYQHAAGRGRVVHLHNAIADYRSVDPQATVTLLYAQPPYVHGDEGILARHSGKTDRREWHNVGTWLYPGDEIVERSGPK